MKNIFLIALFLGIPIFAIAQDQPKVGEELVIKAHSGTNYDYISFPKPNILIKKGIVTRYDSVYDTTVVVDKITTKNNGDTYVFLKKKDGSKFFGFVSSVKANYNKAIERGELSKP